MSSANFGYKSDAEYRKVVADEIAAQEAEAERHSKPIYETGVAREARANELVLQAAQKMSSALADHADDMRVNEDWQTLHRMIDGAEDAEAAALAVTAFASHHPEYAQGVVEVLEGVWGHYGRAVLGQTVEAIADAQAEQDQEAAEEAWNAHIAHRADVLRSVSNKIASEDGEVVRDVAAGMASQDESLEWTDDADAAARLLGYRKVAVDAKASVGKEAFLRSMNDEIERNGWAGRLWSDEEKEKYRREAEENVAKATAFDPEESFAKGHAATHRRIEHPFPFNVEEFNEEAARYEEPEWKARARRDIAAQEAAERRDEGR